MAAYEVMMTVQRCDKAFVNIEIPGLHCNGSARNCTMLQSIRRPVLHLLSETTRWVMPAAHVDTQRRCGLSRPDTSVSADALHHQCQHASSTRTILCDFQHAFSHQTPSFFTLTTLVWSLSTTSLFRNRNHVFHAPSAHAGT